MTHVFYVCDGVLDDLSLEFGEEVEDGLGVVGVSHERVLQQLTGRRPQVRVLNNNAGLNLAPFLLEDSFKLRILCAISLNQAFVYRFVNNSRR